MAESESKVPYPDREDDGCTHCGMVLTVTNKDGSLNVEASEAAQREHQKNTSCAATPAFTDPNAPREIDRKTGKLDGEYEPAWTRKRAESAAGGGS